MRACGGAAPRRRCANGARREYGSPVVEPGDHALHGQRLVHRAREHRDGVDASGRPAPCRAPTRCRASASARRCCRTPPARGRTRRCRCPARTARSPRRRRSPSRMTIRPARAPASNTLRGMPYGLRVPTSPVANWSRLVLPSSTAPASSRRCTAGAVVPRRVGEAGTGGGGRQAGDVDVVLDRERHAPKRPAVRTFRLQRPRARQHDLIRQARDPDRRIVVRMVGGERRLGGFDRTHELSRAALA